MEHTHETLRQNQVFMSSENSLISGCDAELRGHLAILFHYWQPTGRGFPKTIAQPYEENGKERERVEEVPLRSL